MTTKELWKLAEFEYELNRSLTDKSWARLIKGDKLTQLNFTLEHLTTKHKRESLVEIVKRIFIDRKD